MGNNLFKVTQESSGNPWYPLVLLSSNSPRNIIFSGYFKDGSSQMLHASWLGKEHRSYFWMNMKRAQWVNMESQMLQESCFLQHRDLPFLLFLSISPWLPYTLAFACKPDCLSHAGKTTGNFWLTLFAKEEFGSQPQRWVSAGMLGKKKVRSIVNLDVWSHPCVCGTHPWETMNGKALGKDLNKTETKVSTFKEERFTPKA